MPCMSVNTIEIVEKTKKAVSGSGVKALAPVRKWLWVIAFLIFVMVIVGGVTRLTDSGLSITTWDPIMGAIPPLSEPDWQRQFDLYKTTTEYQTQNSAMTLVQFKWIYGWEWSHRQFGRLIGLVFMLPFLFFLATRRIGWKLMPRLLLLLLLGAAQGALGWYMVKSGLQGRTDVSQYRLVAHLSLASLLLAAIVWTALGVDRIRSYRLDFSTTLAVLLLVMVFAQIAAGGFMAGLHAGHVAYDWPKMNGMWIPEGLRQLEPLWRNATENLTAVHFNHRVLAYAIFVLALVHVWTSFRVSSMLVTYGVFVQMCLGVLTLWFQIKLGGALAHQATAMIVLALAVYNVHAHVLSRAPAPSPQ
jgi:heme a synthase